MPMKYDLCPEFQTYSWIRLPTQPWLLRAANALMPVIQHGKQLDACLQSEKVRQGYFDSEYVLDADNFTHVDTHQCPKADTEAERPGR